MRRTVLLLASMALAVLLSSGTGPESNSVPAQVSPKKPNVVLLLTDDLRMSDLQHMPNVKRLLAARGMTFNNHFTTVPTCCPSRVTFLRGQYAHNHKVAFTGDPYAHLSNGELSFRKQGHGRSTVATWAQDAGYRTAYVGKYLNGYRSNKYVPPGWHRWYANTERDVWANVFNSNGRKATTNRPRAALDAHLSEVGRTFVGNTAGRRPFFLFQNFNAPHQYRNGPPPATKKDLAKFDDTPLRYPSFNERDVSDKPPWIKNSDRLSGAQVREIGKEQRHRLASLQVVDREIAQLVKLLRERSELQNTYFFFTSDNGYHMGEHRLMPAKMTPYINDVRVPLIVRGPGVAKGIKRQEFVENVDFAPTVAKLVGRSAPEFVDGRSLVPLMRGETVPWRSEALIEGRIGHPFFGISTAEGLHYVEYREGPKELYDRHADPYQLDNLLAPGRSDTRAEELANRLRPYVDCAGEECRR